MFEDIKKLDYRLVLEDLGIQYKDYGNYAVGKASYRNDNNPSLTVFFNGIWRWKDHGTGKTGTWIDLYILYGYTFKQAIARLYWLKEKSLKGEVTTLLNPYPSKAKGEEKYKNNISYPKVEIMEWDTKAKNFLYWAKGYKQIPEFVYKVKVYESDKTFEYYGIQDLKGNWHIRTFKAKQQLKRVIRQNPIGSYYSLFAYGKRIIAVCEGLHDAMALWTLRLDDYDILCLNSIANTDKALNVLNNYDKVIVATDNDEAGKTAKDKIAKVLKGNLYEAVFKAKDIDEAFRLKENITVRFMG